MLIFSNPSYGPWLAERGIVIKEKTVGKKRILTELDRLDQSLTKGETVWFTDIILALGVDTESLVEKAQALRKKLAVKQLNRSENETRPT